MTGQRGRLGFRSPWLDQLDRIHAPTPLTEDFATDVAIVGAGIAGLATAFFVLRDTPSKVVLLERGRAGHGATGRNAGQLVTYFERPLCDLVDAFGFDKATRGQAEVEAAWGLLDAIIDESGMTVTIDRFVGAMGMFTLNHLLVHLRNNQIRRQSGLDGEEITISSSADFIGEVPAAFKDFYTIVPQSRIRELLGVESDDWVAVLQNKKGCANSALICQELLAYLTRRYPGRFVFADETTVERVILDKDSATLVAGAHAIAARRVVMCTNGFSHHLVENLAGGPIAQRLESKVHARVGYMVGFTSPPGAPAGATSYINNEQIGGKKPYYYSTRRPYVRGDEELTLTCLGGPEATIESEETYTADSEIPMDILQEIDGHIRPLVAPDRPGGLDYEYAWHGLMAYTDDKVRIVGFEPRNRVLMYNLGCNGVGFLPSIAGGFRIARLQNGDELEPSIFDPK